MDGDGASYTYSVSGLPPGLSFDATGTGACGTARTICGTPTRDGAFTVTAAAHDAGCSPRDGPGGCMRCLRTGRPWTGCGSRRSDK